jgi:hypothetical protein
MKSQPLSCPSDIRRFFVSPQESGQICLLACILGDSGDIIFPKLEEAQMINFKDITIDFLKVMGYKTQECKSEEDAKLTATKLNPGSTHYPVYFFESDTSGEKTFEEFYTETEILDQRTFASLGIIKNAPRKEIATIKILIDSLKSVLAQPDLTKEAIVSVMNEYLPTFHHIETGKNLDQKM